MGCKALPVIVLDFKQKNEQYDLLSEMLFFDCLKLPRGYSYEYFGDFDPLKLPKLSSDKEYFILYGDVSLKSVPEKELMNVSFNRAIICGNFRCSKYKKFLPYIVKGVYDCSGYKGYITETTVFPYKVGVINCEYSIDSLDILLNKIPKGLKKLIVQPGLLKLDLNKDKEKVESARRFFNKYPDLIVCDSREKLFLKQELEKLEKTKENTVEKNLNIVKNKTVKKHEIKKIDVDFDKKDILNFLAKKPEFQNIDQIERMVGIILSEKRSNSVNTYFCLRQEDKVPVKCINIKDLDNLVIELRSLLKNEEEIISDKPENSVVQVKQDIEQEKENNVIHVTSIKIDKYISEDIWKRVVKSCHKQKSKEMLYDINRVNINPLDMEYQGPVQALENHEYITFPRIKREYGCTLSQSCDLNRNKDRKRLVWTVGDGPDGLVFVAVDFVPEHDGTTRIRTAYFDLLDRASKRQTFTSEQLSKMINVEKFIRKDFLR